MTRPGFEADRFALMAMDLATGRSREIAPDWDRSPSQVAVSADGDALYVAAQDVGEYPLFRVDVATGEVRELVGDGTVSSHSLAGRSLCRATPAYRRRLYTTTRTPATCARSPRPQARSARRAVRLSTGRFQGCGQRTVHGYGSQGTTGARTNGRVPDPRGPQGCFGKAELRWNPQTYAARLRVSYRLTAPPDKPAFPDAMRRWGATAGNRRRAGRDAETTRTSTAPACALGATRGYMINGIAANGSTARTPLQVLVTTTAVRTRSRGLVTRTVVTEGRRRTRTTYRRTTRSSTRSTKFELKCRWGGAGRKDYRVPCGPGTSTHGLQRRASSRSSYSPTRTTGSETHNSVLWHAPSMRAKLLGDNGGRVRPVDPRACSRAKSRYRTHGAAAPATP